MFVKWYGLAVLPIAVSRQIQHRTAGRFLGVIWMVFVCHISAGLQEFQVLEDLERAELKNIYFMVQPHRQLS